MVSRLLLTLCTAVLSVCATILTCVVIGTTGLILKTEDIHRYEIGAFSGCTSESGMFPYYRCSAMRPLAYSCTLNSDPAIASSTACALFTAIQAMIILTLIFGVIPCIFFLIHQCASIYSISKFLSSAILDKIQVWISLFTFCTSLAAMACTVSVVELEKTSFRTITYQYGFILLVLMLTAHFIIFVCCAYIKRQPVPALLPTQSTHKMPEPTAPQKHMHLHGQVMANAYYQLPQQQAQPMAIQVPYPYSYQPSQQQAQVDIQPQASPQLEGQPQPPALLAPPVMAHGVMKYPMPEPAPAPPAYEPSAPPATSTTSTCTSTIITMPPACVQSGVTAVTVLS